MLMAILELQDISVHVVLISTPVRLPFIANYLKRRRKGIPQSQDISQAKSNSEDVLEALILYVVSVIYNC
jgi:hypothetical protein